MKKKTIILMLITMLLLLTSCGLFPQNNKSNEKTYSIGNYYFAKATYEKYTLTSVGVNGNIGSGKEYEIKFKSRCIVPLFEFSYEAKLYSKDDALIAKYEGNRKGSFDVNEDLFTIAKINENIYNKLNYIIVDYSGKSYYKADEYVKENPTSLQPITEINFDSYSQAMEIGDTLVINATLIPNTTDDTIDWYSSDDNIATVENGLITAKAEGIVQITAMASKGITSRSISIKIMPYETNTSMISKLKSYYNKALLRIVASQSGSNYKQNEFYATIFKKIGSVYYFVTGYENFKLLSGNTSQSWTAYDYNNKSYKIKALMHGTGTIAKNNMEIAVGSIVASGLGVITIENTIDVFENEKIFIHNATTYTTSKITYFSLGSSPMRSNQYYSISLFGAPVFNTNLKFIGFVIRQNEQYNTADIVTLSAIHRFIDTCQLTGQEIIA